MSRSTPSPDAAAKNGKREQALVLTPQQVELLARAEATLAAARGQWEQVLLGIFAAAGIGKATVLRMQERDGKPELVYQIVGERGGDGR